MSDDIRQTNQIAYGVDIYDASHAFLVDPSGNLKVSGSFISTPSGTQDVRLVATTATQPVTEANLDKSYGTWAYYGGAAGTITVAAGQRVLSISCHSTTGGTLTINGGASIPVPANVGFAINPLGNLVAPVIVYSGTDSYFVEVVS